MKRAAAQRIRDALDAMQKAESFIGGMNVAEFAQDIKTLYAVEHCFIIIGEALRHVPAEVQVRYPDVPWRAIIGMRNRIAHDYLYTDSELVWQTVHADFPPLVEQLEGVLTRLDAEAGKDE